MLDLRLALLARLQLGLVVDSDRDSAIGIDADEVALLRIGLANIVDEAMRRVGPIIEVESTASIPINNVGQHIEGTHT